MNGTIDNPHDHARSSGRTTAQTDRVLGILKALTFVGLTFAMASAHASGPTPPGLHANEWADAHDRSAEPDIPEIGLINYFFTRATYTNLLGDPSGLRGVSLGPMGIGEGTGSSVGVDDDSDTGYIEQRWIPVLSYSPLFADGMATFRAQLEVDYAWGIAANTMQNNQGGGFNADQVNIQTKNVNVALYPTGNRGQLAILVGTQSVYDSIYDPTLTSLFDIVQTGYKLTFMGTDATGLSIFTHTPYGRGKASFIPVGAGQPDKAAKGDPKLKYVYLLTLDYAYEVQPTTIVGLTYWHLSDNGKGSPYAYEGLVKSGPGSTGLSPFTGTSRFSMDQPTGTVNYLGAHFHHNINFASGDFGASGFVMYNRGRYESQKSDTKLNKEVEISGLAANVELKYNWGFTKNDVFTLEGLYTTGDDDPTDDTYKSAFTMNFYGLPGAVWFNHKTLILFPFTSTVSNYSGAVTDISNQGYGLVTAIPTAAYDLIPNRLNLKLGMAYARSTVTPPDLSEKEKRGRTIGLEVNAELKYHFRYLMTAGLHVGYMLRGSFYNGNDQIRSDPYAVFTTFTWYAF